MPKRLAFLLLALIALLACPALAEDGPLPPAPTASPDPAAPALTMEDLTFAGIVFPEAMLADCMDVFGPPLSDTMDARSGVITLTYEGMVLELLPDGEGTPRLESMLVTDEDMEGPGGIRIEDERREVEDRFGVSDEEDMDWYTVSGEDGQGYALICTFSEDYLTEYLLYRL